ncbi:STAS domain-containing protein [Streptomyces microflavus]|uniref:STAS domain-containing protein n=1 Tax=Streptomyces microflavus TaxID=1919 RepID=UPI003657A7A3
MTSHSSHSAAESLPVVCLRGEYDLDNLAALQAQIEAVIAAHGRVVLDASGITFADSTFLGAIIDVHRRTDLRVADPSPMVARLLDLVGINTFLRIYPTVDDALAATTPITGPTS